MKGSSEEGDGRGGTGRGSSDHHQHDILRCLKCALARGRNVEPRKISVTRVSSRYTEDASKIKVYGDIVPT